MCGGHAAQDKKSKIRQAGNQERKVRLMVDRCLERAQSMPSYRHFVWMYLVKCRTH